MSTCDGRWEVDLLCQYLHETRTPGLRTGDWYDKMDPKGTLNDRQIIYDALAGRGLYGKHTNPQSKAEVAESMIPWNQQNTAIREAFNFKQCCGSVVKLTFRKYMGWGSGEPPYKREVSPKWNAANWIVRSLRAGKPVRAHVKGRDHFVGIVGFRGWSVPLEVSRTGTSQRYEFLCIDPWAGGPETATHEFDYAGGKTCFLWTVHQEGTKLKYDHYEIDEVEGTFPF
ncbi:MAG: hypothetical protein QOH06_6178 [Acidobacteriota bacterium]|jgi:hypothetical protein|nr:hypothetical protein [Acidobacteriota bacterium]